MSARQTTVGQLCADDLGKRVWGDGFDRNWEDLLESRGTWQGEP